jgi:arylsulfatase A-like enzyme
MIVQTQAQWSERPFVSLLLCPIAFAGVMLPVDFLFQMDGYLTYLRPWELFPVWGWAWLSYSLFGFSLSLGVMLLAWIAGLLFRRRLDTILSGMSLWFSFSVIVLTLVRGVKLWIAASGFSASASFLSRNQLWIAAGTLLICTIAFFKRKSVALPISRIAAVSAVLGGFCAAVALLVGFFADGIGTADTLPLSREASVSNAPNIVMITVDALAANNMSLYGYRRPTTPNLDRLAGEFDVFDRFYANGNFTTSGVNSLINGVRPWDHRANQPFAQVDAKRAEAGIVARLKRSGYQTFAVATNPIAAPCWNRADKWTDATIGLQVRLSLPILQYWMSRQNPHFMPVSGLSLFSVVFNYVDHLLVAVGAWSPSDQYDPSLALHPAMKLVSDRDPKHPFFLWVHLLTPHSPYAAPAPFIGMFDHSPRHRTRFDSSPPWNSLAATTPESLDSFVGRYDEAIACTDSGIAAFLDWLKQQSLYQGSIVVISADHGESFRHNYGGHAGPIMFDDVIRIPLLIKRPNQHTGRRSETLAEQIDIMPTLLDAAGLRADESIQGHSLYRKSSEKDGESEVFSMNFERSPRFGELSIGSIAMIRGRWKYISHFGYQNGTLKDSLFDLLADPAEETDVIAAQPVIAAGMLSAIDEERRIHCGPVL